MSKYHCGFHFFPKWLRKFLSNDPFDNQACYLHDRDFSTGAGYFRANWDLCLRITRKFTYYRKIPKGIIFFIATTLFGWITYRRRK